MVIRPRRRKSGYVTGRPQNTRDKSVLEKLTLMTTLTKASIWKSHNKAFDKKCDKYIWCLIILNIIAMTTLWGQRNTTFCPQSVLCVLWGSEDKQWLFPYTALNVWTLGAFVYFLKRFLTWPYPSVHLSVSLHRTAPLQLDGFSLNLILKFSGNLSEKIQVSLQSDKNNRYFTWTPMYIYDNISLNSF